MKMKSFATTSILVSGLLLTAGAFAWNPDAPGDPRERHGPPTAEHQLARLSEQLQLSDEQSAQMLQVLQAAEAERRQLHEQIMEQMGPELCATQRNTEENILAILTPEQMELFAQLNEERRTRQQNRRGGGLDCPAYDD
jgi:Spy/CpxP family protein refolding chaperone